jgi:four helix bundle protein
MATGVKELKLWQEAVALAGEVLKAARAGARRETKVFTDRLIQSAVAVATHVAEGYGQEEVTEERRLYRQARRALAELETHLAVARHAGVVAPGVLAQIAPRTAAVGRLLAGYLAFIDRQRIAAERDGDDRDEDDRDAATRNGAERDAGEREGGGDRDAEAATPGAAPHSVLRT